MENGQAPDMGEIGENHRRGIAVTLALLDEMLCDIERGARGMVMAGPIYRENDDLTSGQKDDILREIEALREHISGIRDALSLEPRVWNSSVSISSKCSCFWENLVELESRRLWRYGEVPEGFAAGFDPKVEALIRGLEAISRAARRNMGCESGPDGPGCRHVQG